MNELRMYVEHLFKNKMLTDEMIELKEEIYGNLVARYEDYIANGMTESDAIEATKQSITSIDDLLEQAVQDDETDVSTTDEIATLGDDRDASTADETATLGDDRYVTQNDGGDSVGGEGVYIQDVSQKKRRINKPIIIAIVAVVVVVIVGVGIAFATGVFHDVQQLYSDSSNSQNTDSTNTTNSETNTSTNSQNSNSGYWMDPEDRAEYESTMALIDEVNNNSLAGITPYIGVSDQASLASLAQTLPLSEYISSVTLNGTSVEIAYTNVDDNIESEGIEIALAYNSIVMMAASSDLSNVTFSIQEAGDSPYDLDWFVYERTVMNSLLSTYGNGIGQISSDMLANDTSLDALKSVITNYQFADAAGEWAERG